MAKLSATGAGMLALRAHEAAERAKVAVLRDQ
jgi:hypothetical protein